MKVIVLGPVLNKQLSGGVAAVSENLVHGFKKLGIYANMISVAKSDHIENFVAGSGRYGTFTILKSLNKISSIIEKEQPDLVISSLQYNLGVKLFRKKSPKTKFVAVLHGMTCPVDGLLKSFMVNAVAKYSVKHFDKTVTVSYISQAINWKIYKIRCDLVIPNGIRTDDLSLMKNDASISTLNIERPYDFLYVGRLYRDKNVDLLCKAFIELKTKYPSLSLAVVGGGELEEKFKKGAEFDKPGIFFFGQQPHSNVFEFYRKSKIFISLNELEPLATTFMEAACEGCELASPITSGIMQLFWNNKHMTPVDISSVSSLASCMEKTLAKYSAPTFEEVENARTKFDSRAMAQRYLDLFCSIKDC